MAPHSSTNASASDDQSGWFKSSYSAATCTCVEVKLEREQASVRDSKLVGSGDEPGTNAPVITVDRIEWTAFLDDVRTGATRRCQAITLAPATDGSAILTCTRSGTSLGFDAAEWAAFSAGVAAGEFGN